MTGTVCVPFRPDHPDRDKLWAYLKPRWQNAGYEVHQADNPEERFSCAAARNQAAHDAGDWDVAIIADADILLDLDSVRDALELARETRGYVAPYDRLNVLDQESTERILAGGDPGIETPWKSFVQCWPCAFAIHRELWDRLEGMDAVTWPGVGFEDVNFVNRAAELVDLQRVEGVAYHLWHEPRGALYT